MKKYLTHLIILTFFVSTVAFASDSCKSCITVDQFRAQFNEIVNKVNAGDEYFIKDSEIKKSGSFTKKFSDYLSMDVAVRKTNKVSIIIVNSYSGVTNGFIKADTVDNLLISTLSPQLSKDERKSLLSKLLKKAESSLGEDVFVKVGNIEYSGTFNRVSSSSHTAGWWFGADLR